MFDSFELNKLLGAVLGTCLGLVAMNIAAGAIFTPGKPDKPGYEIEVPTTKPGDDKGGKPPEPDVPLEQLLAKADVQRGERSAQKCAACHTFDKGGRPLVGPNLYGVIGRAKASVPGFNYSAGLKGMGGNWGVEDIAHFIQNPKSMIPGTNMAFAGIPRATERADIIVFLNSRSDNPLTFKTAEGPGNQQAQ